MITPSEHHTMNQPSSWYPRMRKEIVTEQANKRALDHFELPLERLAGKDKWWCYFQAKRDIEGVLYVY